LHAVTWIRTCLVIHTLIHHIKQDSYDLEWQEELIMEGLSTDSGSSDSSSDDGFAREAARESSGQQKRHKVKQDLFESGVTNQCCRIN
jgi:hypothetical protein